MIYITGDCHGEYSRFNTKTFPEQKQMTKEDYIIICGDFGYWDESREQEYWLEWLEAKPFTTLWIDGNHENFDLLKKKEIIEWHGGNVQAIRPSVIHLMRGQVYELEGLCIFTFGGAKSHDISGGILEKSDPNFKRKKKELDRRRRLYRINHESWWEEELPSEEELEEGRRNLKRYDWKVDYILSHCCASSTQALFSEGRFESDRLTDYLEEIRQSCEFKKWFFGHYHENRDLNDREIMLYERVMRIH